MSNAAQEHAITFFQTVWTAMTDGDIDRLEELAAENVLPGGKDGWIGRHWLTHTIDSGNPKVVNWVLSKKPQVNYTDDEGFTPLKSALQVEKDCGLPPDAAADLTIQIIDQLVAAGTDINFRATLDETALHVAAMWSSPKVVSHLLACGADPFAIQYDFVPETAADLAKFHKRYEVHAILRAAMGQSPAGRAL